MPRTAGLEWTEEKNGGQLDWVVKMRVALLKDGQVVEQGFQSDLQLLIDFYKVNLGT